MQIYKYFFFLSHNFYPFPRPAKTSLLSFLLWVHLFLGTCILLSFGCMYTKRVNVKSAQILVSPI